MIERKELIPLDGYEPTIGVWLSAMQDARRRTLEGLEGLDDRILNWAGPESANSIGTLLYHITAIEMDWLFVEVLEQDFSPHIDALLGYSVRNAEGQLTTVRDESLEMHLHRLEVTRQEFLSGFEGMSLEDFRRARQLPQYEVTPEWVIHHLMQHEAEHRGQIGELRALAEQALGHEGAA